MTRFVVSAQERFRALALASDACEQSWSIGRGGAEHRFLFFLDHDDGSALALAEAAVAFGFPATALRDWSAVLPGADAIGLAVNRDLTSVRLYVQYWEAVRLRAEEGDFSAVPLYLGFKALRSGVVRQDVYICHPAAPRDRFWPPIATALSDFGASPTEVEAAFAPLTAGNCIYTETSQEGRDAWLATVRRADLDPATIADCLRPITDRSGLSGAAEALRGGAPLVHLAAGEDATKGRFLTLYLESDPDQMIAGFTGPNS